MILLSVGTQLPFDRLVRAVDAWAVAAGRDDVVAQVGPSTYRPLAIRTFDFMEQDRFRALQAQCSLMISHAGMGSIITAMELGKPIIVLARDHRRGEHRNGHQGSTIRHFAQLPGVYAAEDEDAIAPLLDRADTLVARPILGETAPHDFTDALAAWLRDTPNPPSLFRRIRRHLR
ncbi:glycosyltransferase [Sphingomonas silueang]|uniref:glycosyltransferase n=1 Tax=Sphingomonas silueang TaxID=3156617 RepID=UPI0032B51957